MHDTVELVYHVTLWNLNLFFSHFCWRDPLHVAFLGDVACVHTNIQQVEEEEEGVTPHIDTWCNERVWVNFFGTLH